MACGTPSIYSNCSGQLEFAKNKGLPVNIVEERPTTYTKDSKWTMAVTTAAIPGNYYEPDFEHLKIKMRDAYKNYDAHKLKAFKLLVNSCPSLTKPFIIYVCLPKAQFNQDNPDPNPINISACFK